MSKYTKAILLTKQLLEELERIEYDDELWSDGDTDNWYRLYTQDAIKALIHDLEYEER